MRSTPAPDPDPGPVRPPRAGELLREVTRLYARAQREVAECCRTSSTQCHLLVELGRSGPVPLSELGQRLSLEKSWVSRAVNRLVDRGWARKQPNPLDARSWLVSLTAAGEDRVHELEATLDAHAERVLATLGARERAAVARSLQCLLTALREEVDIAACCPDPRPTTAHAAPGQACSPAAAPCR